MRLITISIYYVQINHNGKKIFSGSPASRRADRPYLYMWEPQREWPQLQLQTVQTGKSMHNPVRRRQTIKQSPEKPSNRIFSAATARCSFIRLSLSLFLSQSSVQLSCIPSSSLARSAPIQSQCRFNCWACWPVSPFSNRAYV